MNHRTPIPLEILDLVFTFLDGDSAWPTLEACSAIRNPTLRAAVDRRMYTHVTLNAWGHIPPKIYQYLSSNPHVAKYVRTLHIEVAKNHIDAQWYDQVSSILKMLPPSLAKITLSSLLHIDTTGNITPFLWSNFPATLRNAFLDCLWSPNIIEVSMQRIGGLPLSIFNPCPRLKGISLLEVECTPSTSGAQLPPQIDSLVLARSKDLATIVSWANTGHDLRSLSFRLECEADHRAGYGQLAELLCSYSDTLIDLKLDFRPLVPSNLQEMDPPFSLSHIPKLARLTVSAFLQCTLPSNNLSENSLISTIVDLVATSPSLKRLVLRANLPREFNISSLTDFCKSLVSLVDHSALEHVEVRILSVYKRDNEKIWEETFSDIVLSFMNVPELEKLCNKGFLSVTGPEFEGLFS